MGPPSSLHGGLLGEEAPRLPRWGGRLPDRAAGPEVAPAALPAGCLGERHVRVLSRVDGRGRRGDAGGDVLGPRDVVGQRPRSEERREGKERRSWWPTPH